MRNPANPLRPIAAIAICLSCIAISQTSASTQVGEMRVLESTGPDEPDPGGSEGVRVSRTLKTQMLFRHYFSTPSEATPTDEFVSPASGGAWKPNETLFFVDGRPVRYPIGARMLKPGAIIYYYINRRTPQFISLHTHARPVMGRLARKDGGGALVLRRLIGLKFESSGVVYSDEKVDIAPDARYRLDGEESDAERCLTGDTLIRVHAAQPLTISAFTDEALLARKDFAAPYVGTRAGYISKSGEGAITISSRSGDGWGEEERGTQKATGIWDGQFMFDSAPVLRAGSQAVAFCYRGNTKDSIFVIGRSEALGATDGEIIELGDKRIKVRLHPTGEEQSLPLDSDTKFHLDGQPAEGAGALKIGMAVTVFAKRPQAVDCWTLDPMAVPEDIERVLYGVDGKRSVLQPGRKPKRLEALLKDQAAKK